MIIAIKTAIHGLVVTLVLGCSALPVGQTNAPAGPTPATAPTPSPTLQPAGAPEASQLPGATEAPTSGPTQPPGISEAEAVAVAREHVPADAELTQTMPGPFAAVAAALIRPPTGELPTEVGPTTWVWGVEFSRIIEVCESADRCEDRQALTTAIVNYENGEYVSAYTFAENPDPQNF